MPDSWSIIEVELIIADYFSMFNSELKGETYSKAQHRRALLPLLNNRTAGSVEFKHQNISAALAKLGQPYIKGYLPRFHFQNTLEDKVIDFLIQSPKLELQFKKFAEKQIVKPTTRPNFDELIVAPPVMSFVEEPKASYSRNPIKINYLEREQNNRNLGILGEELVFEYEKWNLIRNGKEKLANQIKWISRDEGDGAGFDILSKNFDGRDKFIEVKTTKLSKNTPIFFSKNELDFSISEKDSFHLYRLFSFEKDAQMFMLQGSLNQICKSEAISFKGYF
jgi:hypothetical protein